MLALQRTTEFPEHPDSWYWEAQLHPAVTRWDSENNYRPSRWLRERQLFLVAGATVRFEPLLEFTDEQDPKTHMSKPGMKKFWRPENSSVFDDVYEYNAKYAQWGLVPNQIYQVELVWDEAFIKVKGSNLVMSAEAFKPVLVNA